MTETPEHLVPGTTSAGLKAMPAIKADEGYPGEVFLYESTDPGVCAWLRIEDDTSMSLVRLGLDGLGKLEEQIHYLREHHTLLPEKVGP